MSTTSWTDECHRAAALFDAGDHKGALTVFLDICGRSDLNPSGRAMMFLNVATTHEKMGQHVEAMQAFDHARIWSLQQYMFVEQSRAVYLIRVGRNGEAIELIEHLLKQDSLMPESRAACESNLQIARQNATGAPAEGTVRFSEAPRSTL
ncbi:MAG: tetratricopeptide repeat protein [Planctomycetes bacterium]|nr:tetratricopeptide repeat protein [Planctomycetota bacterium]